MALDLESLDLDGTQLCVSPDIEFQTWLGGISEHNVATCTDPRPVWNVLVALYYATNGPNWANNENWLSEAPLGEWHGVRTDEDDRVVELRLTQNNLEGPIPAGLANLDKLETLNFWTNRLNGTIPPELGHLSNLGTLWLAGNELSGSIPAELGQLRELKGLSLADNKLTGTIPAKLGQLSNLDNLRLSVNQLTGSIPAELGQLRDLKRIYLHGNELSGSIPAELGQLENLRQLYLSENQLNGKIPSELGQLTNLIDLDLSNNPGLSGALPSTFTDLPLESLYLGGTAVCLLSSPDFNEWVAGIANKTSANYCADLDIEALTVFYNSTDGSNWANDENWLSEAPLNDWYGVTTDETGRVEGLDLSNNNLRGALPSEIADLANLRHLNLSLNDGLIGPLPLKLTGLSLESLNLDGTFLCSTKDTGFQDWLTGVPNRFVSDCVALNTDALVALVGLYNSTDGENWTNNENWLSQTPLAAWHGVTADANGRVNELDLSDNNLSGSLPSSLSKLADLKKLDLGGNAGLLGPMPESLTGLSIESLDLEGTGLCAPSGSGYRTWLNGIGDKSGIDDCAVDQPDWEALVTFYNETNGPNWEENSNWLSAEPLDEWFGVSTDDSGRVNALNLSWNNLLGPLPAALGRLEKLEILNLAGNELSGPIPPELSKLERLRELNLFYCWISGTIPPELGRLAELEVLNLGANGTTLTGTLPVELGKLTKLKRLQIGGNGLYGPIPEALSHLTELEFLELAYNGFSGSIPGELGQLAKLSVLLLNRNQLSGMIPREFALLSKLELLDMSRNDLTGSIPGELGLMTALRKLDLSYNKLGDSVPGELGRLTELRELILAGNRELAGPLPAELTTLSLETLMLGDTQICAPRNAEFQNWLRFVQNIRVTSCAVPVEATAYLTQASQSLDHPVPLVAGEDALLRIFLKATGETGIPMPPIRASFYRGGGVVYVADAPGDVSDVPDAFDEETLTATANVRVPGSLVTPGMEMVIEVDPDKTLDPALGLAGRIPESGRIAPDVRELPVLDLTLIPFLWVDGPDHSVLSAIDGLTPDSDLMRPTRDLLPINDFQLRVHAPVWTSVDPVSDNVGVLGPELEAIYAVEGETGYYMGIFRLAGPQGGLLGIAQGIPSYLSFSILDPFVIAHELGHNLNLFHAPCGGAGGPDPFYPYEDGSIGVSGYDIESESLVSPQTWDLMSYCEPMWISDYSFSRALSHRIALGETIPPGFAAVARGLLLWGGLDEDGELTLEPALVVDAPVKLPDTDGPYTITGEREDGSGLFSLSFAISEYADAEGGSFAFILPVRADWPGNLARITLTGPAGFAEIERGRDGEVNSYMALMRDEVTGEVRGIFRDWPDPSDSSTAGRRIPPEPGLEITVSGGVPGQDSW